MGRGLLSEIPERPQWLRDFDQWTDQNPLGGLLFGGVGDWLGKMYWDQEPTYVDRLFAGMDMLPPGADDAVIGVLGATGGRKALKEGIMGLLPNPSAFGTIKNAAKVADDLPMDEASRMQRAVDDETKGLLGADWFHGTDKDFSQYNLGFDGIGSGLPTGSVWFSDAFGSAADFGDIVKTNKLNWKNPYILDDPNQWTRENIPNLIQQAKEAGHDGLLAKNVRDGAYTSNLAAIFDPELIEILATKWLLD